MHCIRRYDLKIVFALDRVICGQAIYNVNYGRFCCIRVYIVSYSLDGLQLDVDVLAEEVKKEEQEGGGGILITNVFANIKFLFSK